MGALARICSVAINLTAMADFDYGYDKLPVLDFIKDAVNALAHPITFLGGKFFATGRSGVVGQCIDALENGVNIGFR